MAARATAARRPHAGTDASDDGVSADAVERLVVVVTAGATFDGRVHVVAEERPGAPDVDAEREECLNMIMMPR